jgi:large subunit ribosomal protein L18
VKLKLNKKTSSRQKARIKKKIRVRKRVHGTPERPRLCVYRSLHHIYAQLIDDVAGKTLVSVSSKDLNLKAGGNKEAAEKVGQVLAERAKGQSIESVVFDRNGLIYHGRVQKLAEGARQGGLKF